jgi:hypothetical protein
VQLEDGSLSDIEIQKIGYKFPGERAACYSADHLLRQYKRVRGEKGSRFTYQSIKNVYTIVFFENSPKDFKKFPNNYIHKFKQKSDTGLTLELLQEYIFIGLDIFKKTMDNRDINTDLETWLAFLSFDDPARITELFTNHPTFKAMYQEIYDICLNMEEVMHMYSKELAELDRNTVKLMMDEMQEEIDQLRAQKEAMLGEKNAMLEEKEAMLGEKNAMLEEKEAMLGEKNAMLEEKEAMLEEKEVMLEEKNTMLEQKDVEIEQLRKENARLRAEREI